MELLGYFKTAEDGISGIQKLQPDLVFLDVQINDKTGFDLLQQLSSVNFEVIFTTAFERYAVQAFKFSALDYLFKPVDADDLAAALQNSKKKISVKESNARFDTLFHNLKSIQGISKRICVPVTNGLVFCRLATLSVARVILTIQPSLQKTSKNWWWQKR